MSINAATDDQSNSHASGCGSSTSSNNGDGETRKPIYYFSYGPMVHPAVRHRRGIRVAEEKPAVLPDHRLSFAFGGVASVAAKRGYDVHGVVMRCETQSDWDKLQDQETGYYATEVDVYPYHKGASCAFASEMCPLSPEQTDDSSSSSEQMPPIRAFVFVMEEFDKTRLDRHIEQLPQERYLRLIAAGLRTHDADEDYIENEIMGIPFLPSRKPDEYLQFPPWQHKHANNATLPRITLFRYLEFCQKADANFLDNTPETSSQSSHQEQPRSKQPLCFIVGKYMIWVPQHDPHHAGAQWLRQHGSGKEDVSHALHTIVVDFDIPFSETPTQVTPCAQAWAENQLVISFAQGLDAYRAFEMVDDPQHESPDVEIILETLLQSSLQPEGTLRSSARSERTSNRTAETLDSSEDGRFLFRSSQDRRKGTIFRNALQRVGTGHRMRMRSKSSKEPSTGPPATLSSQRARRRRWSLPMLRNHRVEL